MNRAQALTSVEIAKRHRAHTDIFWVGLLYGVVMGLCVGCVVTSGFFFRVMP